MKTIEIKPSEGGADAELFANDVVGAVSRALTRDGVKHSVDGCNVIVDGQLPHWL